MKLKKRFMLSLMTVALVALLASGATYALFTSQTSNNNNTFTAGTVTLNDPAFTIASISNIAPGDSNGAAGETWTVTYSGNLDAFIGLRAQLTGPLATNQGDGNQLQVAITADGVPVTPNTSEATAFNSLTPVVIKEQVASHSDKTVDINVKWNLPLAAGNAYQGDTATLQMQVVAVQQAHNDTTPADDIPDSWN